MLFLFQVIEFLYMSIGTDRGLSEELVTWLSLMEALVLPYFLWFGSRRYKHAICYFFKVHILRRKHDSEESELYSVSHQIFIDWCNPNCNVSPYSFILFKKSLGKTITPWTRALGIIFNLLNTH